MLYGDGQYRNGGTVFWKRGTHKPKNIYGWMELLKCLYKTNCFEEGAEYVNHALKMTGQKPIFFFYKSAFLIGNG